MRSRPPSSAPTAAAPGRNHDARARGRSTPAGRLAYWYWIQWHGIEAATCARWKEVRELIWPFISQQDIDFSSVLDLAAGRGRNTQKLLEHSDRIIVADINADNIKHCRKRFKKEPGVSFVHCNGATLPEIEDESVTFVYCFDSMVHFDLEIIISYCKEFQRILTPGGYGFCHHSNFQGNPGNDFRENPAWRNFMSKELFAHICIRSGLSVEAQKIMDWAEMADMDCLTLFRKV